MNKAVLLLGSNTGEKHLNLSEAILKIKNVVAAITCTSGIFETEPWGNHDQPNFLNMVIAVDTELTARNLLYILLSIEQEMGRERREKWSPRAIDIDILYFNDDVINEEGLTIPHKHLHERKFTLVPLVEILPEMIHPVLKKKNVELLNELQDELCVKVFRNKSLVV